MSWSASGVAVVGTAVPDTYKTEFQELGESLLSVTLLGGAEPNLSAVAMSLKSYMPMLVSQP